MSPWQPECGERAAAKLYRSPTMAGTVAAALNSLVSEANLASASEEIHDFISEYFGHPCDDDSDDGFLGKLMNTIVKV